MDPRRGARRCARALLWAGVCAALWSLTVAPAADAVNFLLQAAAVQPGWSGYWWPMLTGRGWHLYDEVGPFTPLAKYGQATGDFGPLVWERRYKLTTDSRNHWWGHCNGWAVAAATEPEPTRSVQAGSVSLNVGEIKGLLAACHQGDPNDFFAGRRHDKGGNPTNDLRALQFHRALLYYLRDRQEALIVNVSEKAEIWNYPAYAVAMGGVTSPVDRGMTIITATLQFPRNDVRPDFTGTDMFTRTYVYWVRGDPQRTDGATEADWSGESVVRHPPFVWHSAFQRAHDPTFGEPPNPLDYNWVRRVAQAAAGRR